MLNRKSPPISTPLEPCRIAPYVNLATRRNVSTVPYSVGFKSADGSSSISSDNQNGGLLPDHFSLRTDSKNATMSAFDPAIISAAAHKYAAVMGNVSATNMFSITQYPLNLTAVAVAHSKNSSIADLRMKAKKHAESLGLDVDN